MLQEYLLVTSTPGVCTPSHQLVVVRNYQKLDVDKLDEVLTCDDIWDDAFSKFDDPSDCLECFNLIMNELLDCLVLLKTFRVKRQVCPWLSSSSLTRARRLRDIALEIWLCDGLVILQSPS